MGGHQREEAAFTDSEGKFQVGSCQVGTLNPKP